MLDVKLKLIPGHTSERTWMAPSSLRTLFWNTTYDCNYHCGICFQDACKISSDELTTREAMDMLKNARQAGVNNMIISGGEPFMRRDMVDILTYMATLGIKTRIASNGSLLTEEILKRLKGETLTQSFQISLDTLDPDLYAKIHGASTDMLTTVLKSLRYIKKMDFHTTVSTRLTPDTLPTIPHLLERSCEEGWATVTIHLPLLVGRSNETYNQDTDFFSLLKPIFEQFLALPKRWLIEMYIPWAPYHPVVQSFNKEIKIVHAGCRAGRDRLTINPCGDISLCVCFDNPQFYLGNVRRDNIETIFNNSVICDIMRYPHKYEICKECPYVMTCGGGCRIAAYVTTCSLHGQDESCPLFKNRCAKESKRLLNER